MKKNILLFLLAINMIPSMASTDSSICDATTCIHCINGFCVKCNLSTGSCVPMEQP